MRLYAIVLSMYVLHAQSPSAQSTDRLATLKNFYRSIENLENTFKQAQEHIKNASEKSGIIERLLWQDRLKRLSTLLKISRSSLKQLLQAHQIDNKTMAVNAEKTLQQILHRYEAIDWLPKSDSSNAAEQPKNAEGISFEQVFRQSNSDSTTTSHANASSSITGPLDLRPPPASPYQ